MNKRQRVGLIARAQFSQMIQFLGWGWRPGPAGRQCPECRQAGHMWIKPSGRSERQQCSRCGWAKTYHY